MLTVCISGVSENLKISLIGKMCKICIHVYAHTYYVKKFGHIYVKLFCIKVTLKEYFRIHKMCFEIDLKYIKNTFYNLYSFRYIFCVIAAYYAY